MRRSNQTILIMFVLAVGCVLGWVYMCTPVRAQEDPRITTARAAGAADYFAYEKLTVADSVKTMTSNTYTSVATKAICTLEDASIRFTLDGTTPTTDVGLLLSSGQTLTLDLHNQIVKFQAIRTGGTSGTLRCNYGK
jgi:hypothetical protein